MRRRRPDGGADVLGRMSAAAAAAAVGGTDDDAGAIITVGFVRVGAAAGPCFPDAEDDAGDDGAAAGDLNFDANTGDDG